MKYSRARPLILIIFVLTNNFSLFAQKSEPKKRITEPNDIITSKIMGKDYQLYISFPKEYSNNDTISYPVLYVLDGAGSFALFKGAREVMDYGNELENVIVAGIGSGLDQASWFINRNYDYTPSADSISDRHFEKKFGFSKGALQSGGAAKFLKCLTLEIIPYVDSHYKTRNEKGITGHSLGGLFTAYCLLNSNDVFNRFGLNSPSLWWNNKEIFNLADSLLTKTTRLDMSLTKVFISVGGKEGENMVPDMVDFKNLLKSKTSKNVSISWQIFEGETHLSVIPASLSRSLSVLYGKKL